MRKLQDQIAGLASVISARRSGVLHDNGESEQAHAREVEKGLLECVEKMRIQQQEEKTNTIALFQRHCQMTMASQERLAEELHREIQELRKKEGETLEFKQSLSALAEKVDQLNLNNVLLGNIPGQFNTSKGPTASSGNHHAASRNPVPQLPLKKSRGAPEPALAISKMQHKKPALKYSNSADQPVGVSITIGADFDRVQKHEKRFSDDLTSACAWCLQASQDRFVYCHIERGSVIAKLNIVADLTGNDPRSCRRLAEELAAQVAHPHSPVRKAPVTKPATKVVIHQPLTPGRFLATPTLQPLSEVAVSNAFESPREDFSELGMDSPQREAGPEDETWTEAKKQEHLAAMKRRLEEMDAVVSNLAASVPLESNDMEADTSDPECPEMNEHDNLDRTSDAWPPTMHPFTDSPRKAITILPLKSVADLSLEQPPAKAARGDKISTKQHKSRTHSSGHYRALPPTSSAFELESVLSRLEHNSTPVAPHASKRRSDLEQSKANRDFSLDDSQNSKAYLPVGNEFTSSLQIAMLPHSTNQWAVNQYAHEKGTLTPGSEASMNMSRRSASPTESKKWRVLPQWSQNDFDVNGKATPRSQVVIGTPRSQVVSARGGKEPQTLSARPSGTGKASLVKLPIHSNIAVATIAAGSQRGNSPNRRRRQYARSDSSSDDDAGPQALRATARSTPLSSARSNHNQGDNAPDLNAKKKNNAKAILDSDSDEEVRVRTSDLPVRRTVNQRFSK